MLEPLDKSNIPNFANIMDKFKSSEYDPGSKYSVPYTWERSELSMIRLL